MDTGLIMKVAGIGLLVAIACQVLNKAGREDNAMLVSLAGIIVILFMLIAEIGELFETVREVFGL